MSRKSPIATLMTPEEIEAIKKAAGYEGMSGFMRRVLLEHIGYTPDKPKKNKRNSRKPAPETDEVFPPVELSEADEHDHSFTDDPFNEG